MIPYSPIEFYTLGFLKLPPEPAAMTLSFIAFIILVVHGLKKRYGLEVKDYIRFFLIVLLSSLALGRLWFYIAKWKGPETLITLFDLSEGGLFSIGCILGGIIGILIASAVIAKRTKKSLMAEFSRIADIVTPPAALVFFIYRILGCTPFGCTKGTQVDLPWCFLWPDGVCRHPVTVYLAISALAIFFILTSFFRKEKTAKTKFGKRFDGEVALWFLLLYSFNRFWIEFFVASRNMPNNLHLGLNTVQWVCLVVFMWILIVLSREYYILRNKERRTLV